MRQAADELRAELAGDDGHLRRQPQHQRLERLHRRLRVLRLRAGQALTGRLRARRGRVRAPRRRGRRVRRHRALHPVGHPSRLDARGLRGLAAPREGRWRRSSTCTRTRRWRSRTCATSPACRRARCSPGCATPGSARRRARPPRCCTTACASGSRRTSCPSRAGSRSSRPRTRRRSLDASTVMFGHIEEPWELAEHMRVDPRRCRSGRAGSPSSCRCSFIPFHTLLGRTHGIEEISREENLKHTAVFRLALGQTVPNVQASLGEDGPRRRDRGAALGRERPRRHADGGEHQPPGRLLPRREAWTRRELIAAAHAAGRPAAERTTLYEIRARYPVLGQPPSGTGPRRAGADERGRAGAVVRR